MWLITSVQRSPCKAAKGTQDPRSRLARAVWSDPVLGRGTDRRCRFNDAVFITRFYQAPWLWYLHPK